MTVENKHVAITGATTGIGRATALQLAREGAQLTLLCRNREKAAQLQVEIEALGGKPASVIELDMNSLTSIRAAALAFTASNKQLDILVNNAGVVNTERRVSADGFEQTLAVNHFAPFLLTGLLLPTLLATPGARIINVASDAHKFVRSMGFDDMQAQLGFKTLREYGRSKLANILFTRSLATRLAGRNITVNCLHPGAVSTGLGTQNTGWAAQLLPRLLKPFFRTPEQGASTTLYLCTSEEVAQTSGEYFANRRIARTKPWARDDEAAARLWAYTEDTVDFRYPD